MNNNRKHGLYCIAIKISFCNLRIDNYRSFR